MDDYIEVMDEEMAEVLSSMKDQFDRVRTGRATPKLLEPVIVSVAAYGATMPILELATVKAPDARLLVVTPWDKSTIGDIERGIVSAGLGLNPSNDGKLIRVPVPPLSTDRRQELIKRVRGIGEDFKVRIRHIRREYNDTFKTSQKGGDISEDDARRLVALVQDATNKQITQIDTLTAAKESQLLEV